MRYREVRETMYMHEDEDLSFQAMLEADQRASDADLARFDDVGSSDLYADGMERLMIEVIGRVSTMMATAPAGGHGDYNKDILTCTWCWVSWDKRVGGKTCWMCERPTNIKVKGCLCHRHGQAHV